MTKDSLYVSHKNIELACRRQEKKNFRKKGHSLSFATMLNMLNHNPQGSFIIEIRDGYCIMKEGWRDFIKTL